MPPSKFIEGGAVVSDSIRRRVPFHRQMATELRDQRINCIRSGEVGHDGSLTVGRLRGEESIRRREGGAGKSRLHPRPDGPTPERNGSGANRPETRAAMNPGACVRA